MAPAAASAKPTQTDKQNAAQECKTERGSTDATREAFRAKYGTNANKRNAFGKCVSQTSREEEAERSEARTNAAKECKTERGETAESRAAFAAKYGAKGNGIGKCVSQKAKENKAEADAEDAAEADARKNAAKQCDEERGDSDASRAAFAAKYGTNASKRNAFGKCVSQKAKEQQEDEQEEQAPVA